MSKPGPPKCWSIAQRRKRDRDARLDRLARLNDKLDMQRALMQWNYDLGNVKEAQRCKMKVRTIEQQIRYIDIA